MAPHNDCSLLLESSFSFTGSRGGVGEYSGIFANIREYSQKFANICECSGDFDRTSRKFVLPLQIA
eukprot:4522334-Prymnesium_polylepis.1